MNETPRYNEQGLLPAILQDANTGEVLMLAWMNSQAFSLTLETGLVHFWSRSRNDLWLKGKTSGNMMRVRQVNLDCDGDALLIQVDPAGVACHTGQNSCFSGDM